MQLLVCLVGKGADPGPTMCGSRVGSVESRRGARWARFSIQGCRKCSTFLPQAIRTAGHTCDERNFASPITWKGPANMADKNLKAVASFLRKLAAKGTLEQGQEQAATKALMNLRRALRTNDAAKIRAATGRFAALFLRHYGE